MTRDRLDQATPDTWMYPPPAGWTYDQVKDLDLPFDWELVDGAIVVRGMTNVWHNRVRDRLYFALESARRTPYAVASAQCVLVDDVNPPKPDVLVYDERDLDVFALECIPVEKATVVLEVVSPGSRREDRVRKPAMFADARVPYFWRVERGDDDFPVVHELWFHHDMGMYVPAPERPVHTGKLVTERPFPVEVDLRALVTG
ncbi:Uma2 family endonuclease [Streptomyces sp. DSM 42041]|uniref:Uma2 family endonuclease n=1 Tax=Streptomyces hazeniae TaxID=3075538 RepID=A0ABU2NYH1_9ACTN|nr:Uma2 family endonuclease [Streptomyces sp. DSM 42041]MDT0380673.1 Uma2 family endonuclease [Streptomyces sp. DSM 42041]